MKGSIDQVEAYFTGITGIWQRVLTFFAVCWVAFTLAVVAGALHRQPPGAWEYRFESVDWYLVPIEWMVSLIGGFMAGWWGLGYLLFLVGVMFAITIMEANLWRCSVTLFSFQCWHTLALLYSGSFLDYTVDGLELRPGGVALVAITLLLLGWVGRSVWMEKRAV